MKLTITILALGLFSTTALADPRTRDYRQGEVREIQERLVELGFAKGRGFVDGEFGGQTRDVLRDFQRDHKLFPADGEAGPDTVAALFGDTDNARDTDSPKSHEEHANVRCKSEDISSTGDARPIEGWAMRLARKNWREEARARYGEEWADFKNAKVAETKCFEASVGGIPLKRCRLVATPCNPS